MSTSGRKLLSSLIHEGDVNAYLKMGLAPHLFKEGEAELFVFVSEHLGKYGKLPSVATIEIAPGLSDALVATDEPAAFYLDEVRLRHLHNSLKAGVQEISSLLTSKNAEEALAVFTRISMDMYKQKQKRHVTDFRDAADMVYATYVAQKSAGNSVSLPFGWNTLDDMSGGARAGDFVSIVGRPMMGKTNLMLYTARHAWKKAGRRPLIVSMEMSAELIHQRLAAVDTQTKLTHLMKAELSTKAFSSMMSQLTDLKQMAKPLWVVDGNVVKTVDDLIMQCHVLQPDSLWIDAAYLLKHSNPRLGKWDRQAENAEMIKERLATDLEMPVVCSYQLSKESAKTKKKDKDSTPSMEDIHGSDAIAQISSLILGLFQFDTDIEALNKRKVSILKGRSGETGEFTINWDFSQKMDFSEYKTPTVENMVMQHLG